jgi:hypothetical protein
MTNNSHCEIADDFALLVKSRINRLIETGRCCGREVNVEKT